MTRSACCVTCVLTFWCKFRYFTLFNPFTNFDH